MLTLSKKLAENKRQARLMGSAFEFILVEDADIQSEYMDDAIREVKRIETLLTEFSENSQTSKLNACAGIKPVEVDEEVFALLKRSKDLSKITQGAFDITAGALKKLYNFKGQDFSLPDDQQIRRALQKIGSEKITLLDDHRVYLTEPGMHISFGAIGKGYAADKVKAILVQQGIESGVINASGDLTAWGTRPDGSAWKIGIADPDDSSRIVMWIPIEDASVATSGNYEQFFEINGVRYAHNIDPKSGRPVKGIKSVTIISPSAELSDALATAVFVMGVEVGLHFIHQLPNTHCVIIDDQNKIVTSQSLKINLLK